MASNKPFHRVLFIFHRDLRLEDNLGLLEACHAADLVLPCFIFDPRQIERHPYRSLNAIQFMSGCLSSLEEAIKSFGGRLGIYYGLPVEVLPAILSKERIGAVFSNRDYTPFSRRRDNEILSAASAAGVPCFFKDDIPLHAPGTIRKRDGGVYTVFTPYWRQACLMPAPLPKPFKLKVLGRLKGTHQIKPIIDGVLPVKNAAIHSSGGRGSALAIIKRLKSGRISETSELSAVTSLSAHLKFGTCSVREVCRAAKGSAGASSPLFRKLIWRDFFYQIAWFYPHVFKTSFRREYAGIPWEFDKAGFKAWGEGRTGFPIVDAAMRELRTTGFISNRARMIAASFLTKDLLIDWRRGEKHFARYLVDYDPAVNNGNWQWAASTGCDAQPYFRIFNPWLQQRKFDPDCVYIKRWIPELKDLNADQIHRHASVPLRNYPPPLVDHQKQARLAMELYQTT